MADRISILENGTLAQVDEPDNILFYPQDPAVLRILGTPNILTCDNCIDLGNGIMQVECNGLKLFVPHEGGTVRKISILPNHIYLSRNKPEGRGINGFQGTVVDIGASGGYSAITVDVMGQRIVAEIPSYAYREMNLKQGDPVFIILRMKKIQACENTCHHKTSCNFNQIKHLE
jgi:ABC-type sugar transport system ATPase subunit